MLQLAAWQTHCAFLVHRLQVNSSRQLYAAGVAQHLLSSFMMADLEAVGVLM